MHILRILAGVLAGVLAWEMSALLDVARTLTVDYLDSFDYLTNARVLASGGDATGIDYRWRRPPAASLAVRACCAMSNGDLE